ERSSTWRPRSVPMLIVEPAAVVVIGCASNWFHCVIVIVEPLTADRIDCAKKSQKFGTVPTLTAAVTDKRALDSKITVDQSGGTAAVEDCSVGAASTTL